MQSRLTPDRSGRPSHLERLSDWHPKPILSDVYPGIRELVANHALWMIEISVPELFSATKRKIGELLLWADVEKSPQGDMTPFRLLHTPMQRFEFAYLLNETVPFFRISWCSFVLRYLPQTLFSERSKWVRAGRLGS
jgi:hypothetical protein